MLREDPRQVGEQSVAVERLDLDVDEEHGIRPLRPRDRDEALRLALEGGDVRTVRPVDRQAVAPRDEPDDRVGRHGSAAFREFDEDVAGVHGLDDDGGIAAGRGPVGDARGRDRLGQRLLDPGLAALGEDEVADDGLRGDRALADRRIQIRDVVAVQVLGDALESVVAHEALNGLVLAPDRLGELVLARLDGLFAPRMLEPRLDLRTGARGGHEVQPPRGRPGLGILRRDDLDRVTGLQAVVEGDEPVVDAGADGAMPDFGVDGVGEVHGSRSHGQLENLALGCEDVDLVARELVAEGVEELGRVGGVPLPVDELAKPVELGLLRGGLGDPSLGRPRVLLVPPVGGHPVLRAPVHLVRADLDLQGTPPGADHGGVDRLVEVELRRGDVVLDPPLDRGEDRVRDAQGGVAVRDGLDQDSHPDQVVDVLEVLPPQDHLLVDRIEVLGPPGDRAFDAGRLQLAFQELLDLQDVGLAFGSAVGDEVLDLGVDGGIEDLEGAVLQLPLDRVHAQAVSQGRVDLQGLAGLPPGPLGRDVLPGPGVVESVGQLDEEDPDVLRHRDDHLPDGLGGGRLAVLHFVELGHAVDERGHRRTELAGQIPEGVVGVLDRVVEERPDDRVLVHAELGQNRRHRDGVGDVGLARFADLPGMASLGHPVGVDDPGLVDALRSQGAHERLHRPGDLRPRPAGEPAQTRPDARTRFAHVKPSSTTIIRGARKRAVRLSARPQSQTGSVGEDGVDPAAREPFAAAEPLQLDEDAQLGRQAPGALDEFEGRARGPACGQHVVDDEHPLAVDDGEGLELHPRRPVLQVVVDADDRTGESAGLAHGQHADAEVHGERRGEDETPGLQARDGVDRPPIAVGDRIDEDLEGGRIGDERCDVPEQDAGGGKVLDFAQVRLDECDGVPGERGFLAHFLFLFLRFG